MRHALLEVCVDTIAGALAAVRGGAGRIELCASLSEGGLTPSSGLMRAAAALPVPCYAMIRPRSGLFHFSEIETEIMLADIAAARQAGLAGVVLGAQAADGGLDLALLRHLLAAAQGMGATLHRVIDVTPDPLLALAQAKDLGFERVLTSGGQPRAGDGLPLIARMVEQAGSRLSVMPGSGVTVDNVAHVLAATGAHEVHASCRQIVAGPAFSNFDPPGGRFETDAGMVRDLVGAISG